MTYNDYFLRTTDYPMLLELGQKLGVITLHYEAYDEDGNGIGEPAVQAVDGAYVYLGELPNPEGEIIVNGDGVPYIHANLRTTADLRALAMASTDPDVQAALVSLGNFFVTGAEGNAVAPALPYNVWA